MTRAPGGSMTNAVGTLAAGFWCGVAVAYLGHYYGDPCPDGVVVAFVCTMAGMMAVGRAVWAWAEWMERRR